MGGGVDPAEAEIGSAYIDAQNTDDDLENMNPLHLPNAYQTDGGGDTDPSGGPEPCAQYANVGPPLGGVEAEQDVDGVEGSVEQDVLDTQPAPGLFRLIGVKSDRQDLTFVEKVVLSREDVAGLFNLLAPRSLKSSSSGRWYMDLSSLLKKDVATVGLYGSKAIMKQVLTSEGFVGESQQQALGGDTLPPGLYAAFSNSRLAIFYWPPVDKFSDAQRSDISCNFIRYVLELCHTVYCCIEVEDGHAQISSVGPAAQKARTQRLQISVVQSSENDFKVQAGFRLSLPSDAASLAVSFSWCEGLYRSAFLVSRKYTPENSFRRFHGTVIAKELPKLIQDWGDVSLDLSKLKEAEVMSFVGAAKLDGAEQLQNAITLIKQKVRSEAEKLANAEDYLSERKKDVLQVLAEAAVAYLRLNYPWEEQLFSRDVNSTGCLLQGDNIQDFMQYSVPAARASEADEQLLQTKFSELVKQVVFVGSKVRLSIDKHAWYTILKADGRRTGEVCYDDILQVSPPIQKCSQVKLLGGTGFVKQGASFSIHAVDEAGWFSLILLGQKKISSGVHFLEVESPSLAELMDPSAKGLIAPLEKKACMFDFLLGRKANLGIAGVPDDVLLQAVLASSFDEYIPEEHVATCEEKWDQILRAEVPVEPKRRETITAMCLKVYEDDRRKFLSKIYNAAEEVFFPGLSSTIKSELKEKREALKLSFQQQTKQHVADFVFKLAAEGISRPKIVLESFDVRTSHIAIAFQQEVVSRDRVSWEAVELVPMKKDIEIQLSNPSHIIRPQFSNLVQLADMDCTDSKLMKVILLKSGVLVLVRNLEQPSMDIHFCNSLAAGLHRPVKSVQRGFDLVAFDEQTRFMALYDAAAAGGLIKVFKFDDKFASMEWNGVTICLSHYHGSKNITWMQFVSGKEEILIADDALCVRVVEAAYPGMMKPRAIQLPPSTLRLCVTPDGVCLLAVCGDDSADGEIALSAEVYRLDDTLEHIRTIDLNIAVKGVDSFQVAVSSFGTRMYLLIHDAKEPELIRSLLLNVTVSSQSCQLQRAKATKAKPTPRGASGSSCHEIDYLYHVFDKYAVSPPLIQSDRAIQLSLVADVRKGNHESLRQKYSGYARTVLQRLRQEKGKDFSRMRIHLDCQLYGKEPLKIQAHETNMGDFLRQLMCLVPVQVARAQNNNLRPLINGLEISQDLNYGDAVQLADMVQFGVYDAVLESWAGPVKVISSMGKQSSGKSYLLNHLSGSVLDVAGGRCTDGVWMTIRVAEDCLYVILDFEGLGSFERSEQEDMLLSIFNAAISNITIFNKKDFHLDKETEAVFDRFQTGVSLVKDDEKLFKGLFYMAIKDVDAADVDELREEFYSKIAQLCNKSKDNFLTRMYGGAVEVAAMPPFNRVEFHDSISEVAETVKEIEPVHSSGKSFLRDMKLVLAQICSKDWAPIDSKRIAFKVNLLRKHLKTALAFGLLATEDGKQLVDFESEEPISDGPLLVKAHEFQVPDTGLQLSQFADMDVVSTILEQLVPEFEKVVPRKGVDEHWHAALESFVGALVDRRKERVLEWIKANTKAYASDGEVQKLLLEAAASVAEFKEKLALCSCKCDKCFLRCILDKTHSGQHSCKGGHRCSELCSYCADDELADSLERCNDVAGHQGPHDCKLKSHTCGEPCCLRETSSNCNEKCSLKVSHEGEHRCNSRQHMCKQRCSLPSCNNTCVSPVELTRHASHACHEKMCIRQCQMPGCNRKCAVEDHFHSLEPSAVHLCGNEHQCRAKCEQRGICEVTTDIIKKTRTFMGRKSTFEYEHVSEQNGVRKGCCIPVPPFELEHQGPHRHTIKVNAVHFCEERCQGCGYYCNLPINHVGLHDTNHGNMAQTMFVAESEDVEIQGRKYEWGESGVAEMCNLHCKARGRGHIHLTLCEQGQVADGVCSKLKFPDGARHETRKYGPGTDIPKDELTHASYWKAMRFKDPCSPHEQQQFGLCDHFCPSAEHNSGAATSRILQEKTYCTEKLWHEPVPKLLRNTGTGYVTDDGHHFPCNHSRDVANHVIFVVDRSGSMSWEDIVPKLAKFPRSRLGCVYEAMVRFIRTRHAICPHDTMSVVLFNTHGTVGFERQAATEDQVDELLGFASDGGTMYSSGISQVEEILGRSLSDSTIAGKPPAVIFLSDGGNNGGMDPVYCVKKLKDMEPRLVFHTIMFGTDPAQKILQDMAAAGGGIFQVSIDELQLSRSFESLAKSLHSKVAALM